MSLHKLGAEMKQLPSSREIGVDDVRLTAVTRPEATTRTRSLNTTTLDR
jgi:hypothetical protein